MPRFRERSPAPLLNAGVHRLNHLKADTRKHSPVDALPVATELGEVLIAAAALLCFWALGFCALGSSAWGQAQGQGQPVFMSPLQQNLQRPRSAPLSQQTGLQRIRELLVLDAAVAVGGGRGGNAVEVCVISPNLAIAPSGEAVATVVMEQPTLLAVGPLHEVRIERDGRLVWQRLATSSEPIEGPITWPIDPLLPGEALEVKLRLPGTPGGQFAEIHLIGASAEQMRQTEALVQALGVDPVQWQRAIEQQLAQGQVGMSLELLFDRRSPNSPALDGLRRMVYQRGCGP